jgi:hypothetical protein
MSEFLSNDIFTVHEEKYVRNFCRMIFLTVHEENYVRISAE